MNVTIVLGAAKEPMQLRLEEALRRDYDQLVISGTEEEMHYLDEQLQDVTHHQAFSTFGSYLIVCDNTSIEDDLTFVGHQSHTERMRVYQEYFKDRNIENVVLPDQNLKQIYKAFDTFSATVHYLALRFIPEVMKEQARDKNSVLNRYVIPLKNKVLNRNQ